jgi:hypothetical protein
MRSERYDGAGIGGRKEGGGEDGKDGEDGEDVRRRRRVY